MSKFIEFVQYDGRRVYVNVDAIEDVYEDDENVRIDLVSGSDDWYIVKGSYEKVIQMICDALN